MVDSTPGFEGIPNPLQRDLAYNEMTVGANGSVMSRSDKLELRTRHGFCTRCEGVPIQIYVIKKSRFNPLWLTREPRAVAGECAGGICFMCNPDQNPLRKYRRRAHTENGHGSSGELSQTGNTRPGWSNNASPCQGIQNNSLGTKSPGTPDGYSVSSDSHNSEERTPTPPTSIVLSSHTAPSPSNQTGPCPVHRDAPSPSNRKSRSSRHGHITAMNQSPSLGNQTQRPRWTGVYVPEVMQTAENDGSFRLRSEVSVDPRSEALPPTFNIDRSEEDHNRESASSSRDITRQSALEEEMDRSGQSIRSSSADSADQLLEGAPSLPLSHLAESEILSINSGVDKLLGEMVASGCSEFLADIVLGVIREHVNVAGIQSHCLGIIWDLCKENNQNRSSMIDAGAPEDIVKALKAHTQDACVQEKGCGAIWSLAVNSAFRVMLIRAGACKQIMIALQYFIATETVVKTAVGALRTLSPEAEGRDIFQSIGASKVVSEAMVVHRACVPIQRDACAFLSNCAVNMEKQVVAVVSQDELDAVVQAMAYHRHEPSVMQGACFALKNYTHQEQNCRTLRKCKDSGPMILHASQFHQAPNCINDAHGVLDRMQVSQTIDESLEEEACKMLERIAASQINTQQCPRSILDFMRNYDWSPTVCAFCLQMLQRIASGSDEQIGNLFVDDIHQQILRFCLRCDEEKDVCKSACSFLACVSADPSHRQQLVDAGACQIIFKSFVCGGSEEELVRDGLKSLKSLLSVRECYDQCMDKMGLATEAIGAHGSNPLIQALGTAVFLTLDSPPP